MKNDRLTDMQYSTSIEKLRRAYNYRLEENTTLCFVQNVKDHVKKEIFAEWFDYNQTDKVTWLLIKKVGENCYQNIKLTNVEERVRVIQRSIRRGETIA